ncbi:MAG: LCP family protein [Clostridiales bacterium]|nr:LCP family protein [Clostridiales bacterium]
MAKKTNKAKKTKKRMKKRDRVITTLSIFVMLICIIAVGGVLIYNWRPFSEGKTDIIDQPSGIEVPSKYKGRYVNFLLVGLDASDNLTDVIMLMCIDTKDKSAHILNIPRDCYVGTDISKTGKINAVYGNADANTDLTKINKLIKTINDQLMIPIHHYATITLEGFRDAVDSVGGIPINMLWTVRFSSTKVIHEGEQVLNGKQSEWLVRYRKGYNTADIGRIQARNHFMAAAFSHFKSMSATQIATKVVPSVYDKVTTSMSLGEMAQMAKTASGITMENVFVYTLPVENVSGKDAANPTRNWTYPQSLLSIRKQQTADMLNMHFRPYRDAIPAEELGIIELKNTGDPYEDTQESFDAILNGEGNKPR